MTHESEKTLTTYDSAGLAGVRSRGRWSPSRLILELLLGEGVKSMTATDRRLVVDYGRSGEASLHYAPGMLVYYGSVRPSGFWRRLFFRLVCLACVAVLLLEGYPLSLFAALPSLMLAASAFRGAFSVCLEVSSPVPDEPDADIVRALSVAAGPWRRKSLGEFVERLNRAVADHNAPSSPGGAGAAPTATARAGEREGGDGLLEADPSTTPEVVPTDVAPRGLSARDLLRGVLADGDPEDYEGALLDGLEHETRRLAFSRAGSDEPRGVIGGLPGAGPAATSHVFGGPEDAPVGAPREGILGAFVLDAPWTFPHQRYVASYAAADERPEGRPLPAGPAAVSAWVSEAPVKAEDGENLLLWWASWLLAAVRALRRDGPEGPVRAWIRAFPGLRPYRPRVRARWRLQPAGHYAVRMNFHEEVEGDDFYAYHGGLRDAYPPSLPWGMAPGSAGGVDLLTGDVGVSGFREAKKLAERMGEEFAERGVLCDPQVELADPCGYPFELRDQRWPWSAPHSWARETDGAAAVARLIPPHDDDDDEPRVAHVPLAGLAAAVPAQDVAELVLLRADGFARRTNRMAELQRRLDDPRIPRIRKDVLAVQLAEQRRGNDESLRGLLADPAALVALLASVERERELLRGVLGSVGKANAGCLDSFEIRWRLGELERLRGGTANEEDRDS